MKRLIGLSAFIVVFVLSGCFDTLEETTINDNGSGIYFYNTDMGKMLGVVSAFGGDEKKEEMAKVKGDTTVFFRDIKDSLRNLTDAEKKLLENGKGRIILDLKDEKFSLSFTIPFAKPSDMIGISEALGKSTGKIMNILIERIMPEEEKKKMKHDEEDEIPGMGGGEGTPSISSYFELTYENNKLIKKINKEMISKLSEDESLKSAKEMSQMGAAMNLKTVFNLPRPAKKAIGKGITLSDDKKKVTIEGTLDDFFEDPAMFEYEIEY
jgi:hypothetical protein